MKTAWMLQTSFLGDCVLTLPLVHEFLRLKPEHKMRLITSPRGYDLFALAKERGLKPYADRLLVSVIDKAATSGLSQLCKIKAWAREDMSAGDGIDEVFCVQRSLRTALWAFVSGAPRRVGFSSGAPAWAYTECVARSYDESRHEIERNLDLLRTSFVDLPGWKGLAKPSLLTGSPADRKSSNRVFLSVGSKWGSKAYPQDLAEQLIEELLGGLSDRGYLVVLGGDASEREFGARMEAKFSRAGFENHCGKTDVRGLVDLVASCDMAITSDSAPLHIASDLGRPVLALFGPTLPSFGFAPWRPHSIVLQVEGLACRPCHLHGPPQCPLGHHKCLREIPAKRIRRFVDRIMTF